MASDGLIREVFDVARAWLEALQTSVSVDAPECKLLPLPPPAREPTLERVDARFVKLAETSLGLLPLPMQTLLRALIDLKHDICRDRVLTRQNYEARQFAVVENAVSGVLKTLEAYRHSIRDALAAVVVAPSLQLEILEATGQEPSATNCWPQLQTALQRAEMALAESLRASATRQPVHRAHDTGMRTKTIEKADAAVDASRATRERLVKLAQGPLASLFELPPDRPLDDTTGADSMASMAAYEGRGENNSADLEQKVATIKGLMRRIQSLRRERYDAQHVFIDTARATAEASLRELRRTLRVHAPDASGISPDLAEADQKLQSEVALILQTLTVDRQNLDLVLRHIKASCKSIEEESAAESVALWATKAAEWRVQLERAYGTTNQAFSW